MRLSMFVDIVKSCEKHSRSFIRQPNAARIFGFRSNQKISVAMRVIAYGIPADYTDEYLRIGEDTTISCVRMFAKTVLRVFGPKYLRAPKDEDVQRFLHIMRREVGRGC
jgi:hypothetical protein